MGREVLLGSLVIDHTSPVTFQQQIYLRIRDLIRNGKLHSGDRLPSSRQLSDVIGVARNTVSIAYALLASDGYVETRHGLGTLVARSWVRPSSPSAEGNNPHFDVEDPALASMLMLFKSRPIFDTQYSQPRSLRPFTPDVRQFPFKTWRRLMARRSMLTGGEDLFGYGRMSGLGSLRRAVADFLAVNRGVRSDPEQIIITNGAQAALNLISRILLHPGDTVWMEEPGYYWARFAFLSQGSRFAPLRVGPGGAWDTQPPRDPVKLLYVSPSCQHPLGKVMPPQVRRELAARAARNGFWIIEDDFGSEFIESRTYAQSIQGMDSNNRTIYVGSFSKSMFPALRVGFMVLPRELVDTFQRSIFATGHVASLPPQAALSDFISEGHFARHLARMRKLYADRKELFLSLCAKNLSDWMAPVEDTVGLQVPYLMNAGLTDDFAQEAENQALNLLRLSTQFFHDPPRSGLVLGYAALNEPEMAACIEDLRRALSEAAA